MTTKFPHYDRPRGLRTNLPDTNSAGLAGEIIRRDYWGEASTPSGTFGKTKIGGVFTDIISKNIKIGGVMTSIISTKVKIGGTFVSVT